MSKNDFWQIHLGFFFRETIKFFKVRETMQSFLVYEHNFYFFLLFFAEKNLGIFPVVNI